MPQELMTLYSFSQCLVCGWLSLVPFSLPHTIRTHTGYLPRGELRFAEKECGVSGLAGPAAIGAMIDDLIATKE